jgi:hypothetical protein
VLSLFSVLFTLLKTLRHSLFPIVCGPTLINVRIDFFRKVGARLTKFSEIQYKVYLFIHQGRNSIELVELTNFLCVNDSSGQRKGGHISVE